MGDHFSCFEVTKHEFMCCTTPLYVGKMLNERLDNTFTTCGCLAVNVTVHILIRLYLTEGKKSLVKRFSVVAVNIFKTINFPSKISLVLCEQNYLNNKSKPIGIQLSHSSALYKHLPFLYFKVKVSFTAVTTYEGKTSF